jgi:hypothetical protein
MTAKDFKDLTYSDLPLELQREIVGLQYALRAAVEELAGITGKTTHEHSHWLNEAATAVAASLTDKEIEKTIAAMDAFRSQSQQGSTTAQVGDRVTGIGWVGHDQQPVIATGGFSHPQLLPPRAKHPSALAG